ncbi:TDT family transporter [Streptomyces sp. NPDC086777]|uniref:SLAC1 family transporter n=1 Tax=Streptomyces sp. NPDC086777 TaxID=3154866 RepID=UPI0034507072
MSKTATARPAYRVSLNYFAIPLGLAGLGGAWTAAPTALNAPEWVDGVLFSVSGVCWLAFTVVYVGERVRDRGAFRADREHPVDGASAAFLPVVGILLTMHFEQYVSFDAARMICWLLVFALSVVAGQLFAHWLTGRTSFDQLHPGYFLPLVAGPFVASIGLSTVHAQTAARAALGAGIFFWVIIGGVITARLITAGPLPYAATPALSVLLAPPATGGVAAFAAYPGPAGTLQATFLGIFLMTLMVQVFLLPKYRKLAFGLGFWNFTFPASVSANYIIRWCRTSAFAGWEALAWTALGLATVIVLVIAAATLRSLLPAKSGRAI